MTLLGNHAELWAELARVCTSTAWGAKVLISIRKVKSHCGQAAVDRGVISDADRRGHADAVRHEL